MNLHYLNHALDNTHVNSGVLLSRAKFIDESLVATPAFLDRRYLPFYFHLGREIHGKRVLQIGSVGGLVGRCFLHGNTHNGCHGVEKWVCVDKNPIKNIVKSNIGDICSIVQEMPLVGPFDLVLVSEELPIDELQEKLHLAWTNLESDCYMVVDHVNGERKECFEDFCGIKNREPIFFKTRYGLGVVKK